MINKFAIIESVTIISMIMMLVGWRAGGWTSQKKNMNGNMTSMIAKNP